MAAEHGDGWMPIVEDVTEFETQLTQLQRLCEQTEQREIEVTAVMFPEPNEHLLGRCAELGVRRCVMAAPFDDLSVLQAFLERYLHAAELAG